MESVGGILAKLNSAQPTRVEHSAAWLREFLEQMGLTAQTFRAEMDDASLEAYRQALADLTERQLRMAFEMARKKHLEFMPSPAQIREYLHQAKMEMMPAPSADCRQCGGSGWRLPPGKDTVERCKHTP